ncbi:MAG: hypothetical protein QW224_04310 [Desulfurococcaceae archaeon]
MMNSALMVLGTPVKNLHYFIEQFLSISNGTLVLHLVLSRKNKGIEAAYFKEFLKRGLLRLHVLKHGSIDEAMELFVDIDPSILILFLADSCGGLFIPLARSRSIPIYSYALNCFNYVCEGFYSSNIDILLSALRREFDYAKRGNLYMVWNC